MTLIYGILIFVALPACAASVAIAREDRRRGNR